MAKNTNKLEIALAELNVLLTTAVKDISEIKQRLTIMDEQFARKEDMEKNSKRIDTLVNAIQTLEVRLAVTKTELRTWGIIGGIIVTLLSAGISALQIRW